MAKDNNYNVNQGDSFKLNIRYWQPGKVTPVNLTGGSVIMEVKDKPGGSILCATASSGIISASGATGDGITITSPSSGWINISLSPSKTRNLNLPRSAFQIQFVESDRVSTVTLDKGWLIVDPGVID